MDRFRFRHYVKRFLNDEKNDGKSVVTGGGMPTWDGELYFSNNFSIHHYDKPRPDNRRPLYPRRQSDWLFDSQIPDQGEAVHPERGGRM